MFLELSRKNIVVLNEVKHLYGSVFHTEMFRFAQHDMAWDS